MGHKYEEPVYPVGIIAKSLKVCPATLRIWEKRGLIRPVRLGKNRYYSQSDLDRLALIKNMIRKERINIEGIKSILGYSHCWEIKRCGPDARMACPVYRDKARGKSPDKHKDR